MLMGRRGGRDAHARRTLKYGSIACSVSSARLKWQYDSTYASVSAFPACRKEMITHHVNQAARRLVEHAAEHSERQPRDADVPNLSLARVSQQAWSNKRTHTCFSGNFERLES